MKLFLFALALFVPFCTQAGDDRNCEIGIGFGQVSIPVEKFKFSNFEKKLAQTPEIFSSREVHSNSSLRELSLGCFVSEHLFIGLNAMEGMRFSIVNTVAVTNIPQVINGYTTPFTVAKAVVTRQADANVYGVVSRYEWHPSRNLGISAGGGVYHAKIDETSQIFVSDDTGYSAAILDQTKTTKERFFPLLSFGFSAKKDNMRFSVEVDTLPKGVRVIKTDVRFLF